MNKHLRRSTSGHLLRNANGHLVNECPQTPAPCSCDTNLAGSYAMQPTLLTACTTCSGGNCSTYVIWDGTFQYYSPCTWIGLNANFTTWPVGQCLQVDGANLSTARIWLNPYDCQWELTIKCFSTSSNHTLWQGIKTTGNTPTGTYTKVTGCGGPAALGVL